VHLVERGVQRARLGRDVDQAGTAVERGVLLRAGVLEAHLLQHRQLDLEELDGDPTHLDLGACDDRRGQQRHGLDRVLGRCVLHVHVDVRTAVHGERGGPDALDPHPELLEVEAQVLDHVVAAGVADDGHLVQPGCRHHGVLGDGVAALGQDDGSRRHHPGVAVHLVAALGRDDLHTERPQRALVRLHGPGAELAPPGVRNGEGGRAVQQRAEQQQHRARTTGGGLVQVLQVQGRRRSQLQVAVPDPGRGHPDTAEHLKDPVDLLDAGDPAQHGRAVVEQAGAEQGDRGVLARLDLDRPGQLPTAHHPQVGRPGRAAQLHQTGVEGRPDARQDLQGDVLPALLDPGDRALARAQRERQLLLRQVALRPGVAHERADLLQVALIHDPERISVLRYSGQRANRVLRIVTRRCRTEVAVATCRRAGGRQQRRRR